MIVVRFLIPLFFSLLIGVGYSSVFQKKFFDSLAPAFFIQIIIMLFSATVLGSVNIGIIIGVVLAISAISFSFIRKRINGSRIKELLSMSKSYDLLVLFFVVYCFVFISNYGKCFIKYDEFSHWGIFIKETLRLDKLFCTSTAAMAHKDYVPAGTLFEVLWCRLSFRFNEADCYRGIQMLQVSMMLPMATYFSKEKKADIKEIVLRCVIVILIPLYISSSPALWLYHTIYKDVIFGIMLFYCMWIAITEEDTLYALFIETLALTVMILAKMTAPAVIPMVVVFFVIFHCLYHNGKKYWLGYVIMTILPFVIWFGFNRYVDMFVPNSGNNQSYDGIAKEFLDVIVNNGTKDYQHDVVRYFCESLFKWQLVGKLSFVWAVSIVVIMLLVMAISRKNREDRHKIILIDLWILLAGIAYSILTLVLYCTAFGEGEARVLASYERYMSTFLFTVAYLFIAVYYIYFVPNIHTLTIISIVVVENVVAFLGYDQIIPGAITGEEPKYSSETTRIVNLLDEGDSIYVVTTEEEKDKVLLYYTYYCSPIKVIVASNADDNHTIQECISNESYLSFYGLDNDKEQYWERLFNIPDIEYDCVYHALEDGSIIKVD